MLEVLWYEKGLKLDVNFKVIFMFEMVRECESDFPLKE